MDLDFYFKARLESLKQRARWGIADMKAPSAQSQAYMDKQRLIDWQLGVLVLLTRDTGHHSCGWWKNPDYEACLHLSLSFFEPSNHRRRRKRDRALTDAIIEVVFGPTQNLIWSEPPYSPEGKKLDVWHYRVFYDPTFAAPILPRGEVYNKHFTEAGWLSWSDYRDAEKKKAQEELERAG